MAEDKFTALGFTEAQKPNPSSFEDAGFVSANDPNPQTASSFETEGFSSVVDQTGPTFGEQASAAIESGGRGAMTSTGLITGAIAGAKTGAAIAPFTGPAAPFVPFVTGAIGAIGGAILGSELGGAMGLREPSELPQEVRSAGYFGESLFGSVPIMATPYGLATSGYRAADTVVGRLTNTIIDSAKTYPIRFGAVEASAATSAAIAAGFAEEIAPGQAGVRIPAEIAGGVFNIPRMTMATTNMVMSTGRRVIESMSPAARETAAGRMLNDLFTAAGEDPQLLAYVLRNESLMIDGKQVPLTAAQVTGSPTIAALEKYLANISPKFGLEAERRANDALDIIRSQISLYRGTGDPNALTEAAKLQSVYFKTLIQGRVDGAMAEAVESAARITTDTPGARAEINNIARGVLNNAIVESRKAESELWNAVDGTRSTDFNNLRQAYDDVVNDLIPEVVNEKTPKIVRDFIKRVGSPVKGEESLIILPEGVSLPQQAGEIAGTNVSEMRQLRSELLDLARQSTTSGDYGQARIYNNLAEAVLDDLDAAFAQSGDTAYEAARQFSKEFNDTFTRSFVGKVTATGRYGDRIMPELTLTKALATGKEAGAIQLQELEEATRFMVTRGFGDPNSVQEMMSAQERIIRLAAADAIDPKTGLIKPAQLTKFLRDNEVLMNRFPEIRDDILKAVSSDAARLRMENLAKGQTTLMNQEKAFTSIAKAGQVSVADRMLIASNQQEMMLGMINTAKVGGKSLDGKSISPKEATEGLRAAVMDAAMRKSTRRGTLDLDSFEGFLFTPRNPGEKSPIQLMQENGVISDVEVKNMTKLLETGRSIQTTGSPTSAVEMPQDVQDVVVTLISRLGGSIAAGQVTQAAGRGGNSIIIHGAAARFAENVVSKLPVKAKQQILVEAMLDPEKAALLLDKVDTPAQLAFRTRQINAWLVQSGIVTGKEIQAAYEEQRDPMAPGFLRR
jgi:hypothetical protein